MANLPLEPRALCAYGRRTPATHLLHTAKRCASGCTQGAVQVAWCPPGGYTPGHPGLGPWPSPSLSEESAVPAGQTCRLRGRGITPSPRSGPMAQPVSLLHAGFSLKYENNALPSPGQLGAALGAALAVWVHYWAHPSVTGGGHPGPPSPGAFLLAGEAGRRSGPMAQPTLRLFSGYMRRRFLSEQKPPLRDLPCYMGF